MFIHLHNHSHYSILEWLPKPGDYVKKAKDLKMKAVAITDTFNIHWCHEFYKACKVEWIKPILWAEIYVEWTLDKTISHKLVLLAKNLNWYRNIIRLITKANLSNFKWLPKIKFTDFIWCSSDIICLSWPISWEISYYILSWKTDKEIISKIREYEDIFWKENYFLELLYHDDIPKQRLVTDKLIDLYKRYNLQVVATNNCYYIEKKDKKTQDVIIALWNGYELENPDRPTMINWDYSFLTEEEIEIQFWFIPEAISNTEKIANMVNIEIKTGWILIPIFELPEEHKKIYDKAIKKEEKDKNIKNMSQAEWYLRYLSFKWLNWRFGANFTEEEIFEFIKKLNKPSLEKKLTKTSPEELKNLSLTYYTKKKETLLKELDFKLYNYIERLEYELVVIHEMWFDGYFLIVADYINWARQENIPVWPWRWSAAWSLMAYLSGITDLNPLEYGLLFERFLNPARISMPDIDTDFADNERDKVVDYCREKYWADHVAQICTFGTFAARASVKDVWRVFWIPFAEMNKLAKLIPEKSWTKLKDALEESLEFKQAYEQNEKYKEIIDNALKIEWNVRQVWVHACAVIIAPEPMTNFTSLTYPPKDNDTIITQYSAYPLEDLWLLKMDFLWLRNLTIIKRALKIIKRNKWDNIDILNINLNNSKVFEIFASGDTTWVFQFESDWMRKYLKELKPNCFEDIIVMVSLYRPWPIKYIPTYIDRKYWREKVTYPHNSLEKILSPTHWIAVYQEQIMQMVQAFAGFSLWEADILRRAIWKKKIKLLMEQKKNFIRASEDLWHSKKLATHIFEDVIEPFAGYGFNKSHAACYAHIAYQTAYLKAYYGTEFLTAIMVSDEENMERVTLEVAEAESKNINILPPDINESLKHFTYIDDKNIRFWLKAIKWLWNSAIEKIKKWRKKKKYKNLKGFIKETWKEVINKKSLESLIMSWAMDIFWDRNKLYKNIHEIIRYSKTIEKNKESNQMWFFDILWWDFDDGLNLEKVKPFSYEEKLFWEREVLWFMVSGHPLDSLKNYCQRRSKGVRFLKMSFSKLNKLFEKDNKKFNEEIKKLKTEAIWVIIDFRKIITKNWKNMMFLKCEWFDYDFEITIFDKDYLNYKDKIEIWKIAIVKGFLNINLEYTRKSIYIRELQLLTLTQIRQQARDMELLNNSRRKIITIFTNIEKEKWKDKEIKTEKINKYIIKILKGTVKQDLIDLKNYLGSEIPWKIKIFILLQWKEIDTKYSISDLKALKKWIKNKWI